MPIDLADIPAAVADYLDNQVTTSVSPVVPKRQDQDALTAGQTGSFTVTVTNVGSPDGVRLANVTYHVKISDDSIAQLIVPRATLAACYDALNAAEPLLPGSKQPAI